MWDLATRALQASFPFDEAQLGDMQNGLLWLDATTLATVSLNGDINLLDPTAAGLAGARKATLQGHQVGRSATPWGVRVVLAPYQIDHVLVSFSPRQTNKTKKVTVTALAASTESPTFYTASYDGVVVAWHKATGKGTR